MAKKYKDKIYILPEEKEEEQEDKKEENKEIQESISSFDKNKINWHRYNLAKTNEKRLFLQLLYELCKIVPEPIQEMGRPRARVGDVIFCLCLKLYHNFSGRRIISDLKFAEGAGYISKSMHYNTMFQFLNCEVTYDLLKKLLTITAIPLKGFEKEFSMDASGFGSYQYERWQRVRFKKGVDGKINTRGWRNYLKGHIGVGIASHIICSAEITHGNFSDVRQAPLLLEDIGNNFKPKRITADKAYSSHLIHQIIESLGAMPFIAFKKNSRDTENSPDIWKKMYRYFKNNEERFMHYYHKRSNVESVFSMVKIKFGEFLKCKNYVSQRNELMIKFIVHNICVLIDEIYKSGLNIDFKNSLKSYVDRREKEEEFYRN